MDIGSSLANPWFPFVVVGCGLFVMLATLLVPVWGLPAALRRWSSRSRTEVMPLLAGSAGAGAVIGAVLAVRAGGPGALVWMWITTALGMALTFTEATLAARQRRDHPSLPAGTPFMASALGSAGRFIAIVVVVGTLVAAILLGMLQTQQIGELAVAVGWSGPAGLLAVAVIAVCVPLMSSTRAREALFRFGVPLAIAGYLIACLVILARDPLLVELALGDAINAAFGQNAAAAGAGSGAMVVAMHYGVMRAILAGNVALGCASAGLEPQAEASPPALGKAAMLVPAITAGLLSTASGLVILTAGPGTPIAEPKAVAMERHESRGLRPSRQVGQTVVLPEGTAMEAGKHYAMLVRADARGHQFAKLFKDDNRVVVPSWGVTQAADTVVFRSKDRPGQAGWDIQIPCERKVIGDGKVQLLELSPRDPELRFDKIITYYELDPRPFVLATDFQFTGEVAMAQASDSELGTHLAMFEAPDAERTANPKLHEFFRAGFRGPYHAEEPVQPRPPFGFVAREGFEAPLGSVVRLRLEGLARGIDVVRVNRVGRAESPPWDHLLGVRTLVLRHESDPTRDILVPVQPERDGFRIRYESQDPRWEDFRKLSEGFTGPFALVAPFEFAAEVHGDARLPIAFGGRRSLIPLDLPPEPRGPTSYPARPHPAELIEAGMSGPYLAQDGVARLAGRFGGALDSPLGVWGFVLAVTVLASAALVAWAGFVQRVAAFLLGPSKSRTLGLFVLLAAVAGGWASLTLLVAWIDFAVVVLAIPNLVAMLLLIPQLRRA